MPLFQIEGMMEEMSYPQAIILAIIQALTEFLPISSSGHLVIFQKLSGLSKPPILFDISVHLGTLGAVVFYIRKRLARIIDGLTRKDRKSWRLILMIAVGTVPAAIMGLFLQKYIESLFNSLKLVGFCLLITAGLLFSTVKSAFRKWPKDTSKEIINASGKYDIKSLRWFDVLFVGLFQALAVLPGVSRSGSTIVAGLWRRLDREAAFHFSFYLAIPAIIGATILQIPELIGGQFNYLNQAFLGMMVAGIVGYFALIALKKFLLKGGLWFFGVYCLFLGLLLLFFP